MTEVVDQLRKLQKALESKLTGRRRNSGTRCCRVPISPFTPNGNAAARRLAQDQRLGSTDTSGFKNRETLALQRMEGMSDFGPSQRLVGFLGSSR
jgi:hypothetical protein